MTDEGDIPSILCKMRKVDGFSLIFIYFYAPALTPRLSITETTLQLSANKILFAVCGIYTDVISKEI
jgi:hypothetical protein